MKVLALALAPTADVDRGEVLDIQCGSGQQILRWLGYAACTRLAQKRGTSEDRCPNKPACVTSCHQLSEDGVHEVVHGAARRGGDGLLRATGSGQGQQYDGCGPGPERSGGRRRAAAGGVFSGARGVHSKVCTAEKQGLGWKVGALCKRRGALQKQVWFVVTRAAGTTQPQALLLRVGHRWETRPKTPALSWEAADGLGAAVPSPTAWLEEWDLHAEGLAALALAAEPGPQHQHQHQPAAHPQHHEHQQAPEQHAQAMDAGQQDAGQHERPQQATPAQPQHQQHAPVLDPAATVAADLERLRGIMLLHAGRAICWVNPTGQHKIRAHTVHGANAMRCALKLARPMASVVGLAHSQARGARACVLAGALQMLFLLGASEASSPVDTTTRMGLQQFKTMLQTAKVTSSSVPPERVDELYMALQAAPGALARCAQAVAQPAASRRNCRGAVLLCQPGSSLQINRVQPSFWR